MISFDFLIDTRLPAEAAFSAVLDLPRHSEVIPLTTISGDAIERGLDVGSTFVARTGLGSIGFDDIMRLDAVTPPRGATPGHAHITKLGSVVTGDIDLEVTPAVVGSVVHWRQRIGVRGVPRVTEPVLARFARAAYRRSVVALLKLAGG